MIFILTQETLKELRAFIVDSENSKVQDSADQDSSLENKSHDAAVSDTHQDPPCKRVKLEPSGTSTQLEEHEESRVCVVCFGILQDLCGKIQAVKVCDGKYELICYEYSQNVLRLRSPFWFMSTDSRGSEGTALRV